MVTISVVFALFNQLHMKVYENKCAQYVHLSLLVRYDDSMFYAIKVYISRWHKDVGALFYEGEDCSQKRAIDVG